MKLFANRIMQNLENKLVGKIQDSLAPAQKLIAYYKCALMEIETKFNVLNEEFSLIHERNPIETIKTRIKSWDSIRKKMQRLQLPKNIESIEKNLHDIAGIRVICPFIDDIYVLANCLTRQDDISLIEKKDYIAEPKENGYRSLHLIIELPIFLHNEKRSMKVEVQLRTIAMDFWASLEHRLRYKKDINTAIAHEIAGELTECAATSAGLDLKMQKIREKIEGTAKDFPRLPIKARH
jgi:putative GTP pyrophosphokinase